MLTWSGVWFWLLLLFLEWEIVAIFSMNGGGLFTPKHPNASRRLLCKFTSQVPWVITFFWLGHWSSFSFNLILRSSDFLSFVFFIYYYSLQIACYQVYEESGVSICHCSWIYFLENFKFFFVKIECSLYFLYRFDVLISKIIFKK